MIPLKCILINTIKLILMHLLFNKIIHLYVRAENRTSGLLLVKYKQTACKASTKMNNGRYLFISIISITPRWTIVIIIIYEFSWIKAIIYVLNSNSLKSVERHHNPFFLSSSLRSRVHQKFSYPLVLRTSTILNLVIWNPRVLVKKVLLKLKNNRAYILLLIIT